MDEQTLTDVKVLLGITDAARDSLLETIILSAQDRLKLLLGGADSIPNTLRYIVTEVAVSRFNRIGSEGMSSHTVEGETISFADDDFSGFMDDIEAYQDEQTATRRGRVRFL